MYKPAWDLITVLWEKEHLRYWQPTTQLTLDMPTSLAQELAAAKT